jgi:hypothetical protein
MGSCSTFGFIATVSVDSLPPRRAFRVSRGVQAALGVQGKSGYRSIRDARIKRAIEHTDLRRDPLEGRKVTLDAPDREQAAIRLHHAGPSLDRLSRAGLACRNSLQILARRGLGQSVMVWDSKPSCPSRR